MIYIKIEMEIRLNYIDIAAYHRRLSIQIFKHDIQDH